MGLVAEPRPDKNGKVVTRRVRPNQETTSAKKKIPAPQSFGKSSQELSQSLGMALGNFSLMLMGYGISLAEVMQRARRVPDETAEALLRTRERSIPSSAFDLMLVAALREEVDTERLENIALIYSDDQYHDLYEDQGGNEAYRIMMEDINGLSYYPQLGGTSNFYRADNRIRKAAVAIVSVMKETEKHPAIKIINEPDGKRSAVLKDERLVQLAVDNADNIRPLLNLMDARGHDVDILIEGLSTSVPLRQGVL